MNFLSLFPNTMSPQKWLRPFKTSPRKWYCLCLFFLTGRHGVIFKWLITNTLKVKIHKWYVKSTTQFYLSTKKNPLEIKTEIRVIITRFLFFRFFSECLFHANEAQSLQVRRDAICPLGGDLPTLITYNSSSALSLALDKNWNLITAAAHLHRFLR